MKKVLVYEYLCAQPPSGDPQESLAVEGRTMLAAVARELAPLVEVTVAMHPDRRPLALPGVAEINPETVWIGRFDAVLPIAPEIGGTSERWSRRFQDAGFRLLGPGPDFIARAADKSRYGAWLGGKAPSSCATEDLLWIDGDEAIVVKPADGVGALGTLKGPAAQLSAMVKRIAAEIGDRRLIAQPYLDGVSVSVGAFGRGAAPPIVLPAVRQAIEKDPVVGLDDVFALRYAGGVAPFADDDRAAKLAAEIVYFYRPVGYFGVDAVLHPTDPTRDVVVDVNPRITTSFLAYARLFPGAMGRLLLGVETEADLASVAEWRERPKIQPFRFYPDGTFADAAS